MNHFEFFTESLRNIRTTGTIVQSSRFLCRKMTEHIPSDKPVQVVELGAGDGKITRMLLKRLHPESRLFSFEINPKFCTQLRNIQDPRLHLVEGSAEYMRSTMSANGLEEVDYIVSALPFVVLPDELSARIVQDCADLLRPGGIFAQMHYSLVEKKRYQEVFGNLRQKFVPINIPPAWVFLCEKK